MGRWRSPKFGSYGNSTDYLVARIARDRPDILARMKLGEYDSARKAARDAGIIAGPYDGLHEDDIPLVKLMKAWDHASLEVRQAFLVFMDREIEAAYEGQQITFPLPRKGPTPWNPAEGSAIPEIEEALAAGTSVNDIARQLGVSPRTLRRWRSGDAKPNQQARERINTLVGVRAESP